MRRIKKKEAPAAFENRFLFQDKKIVILCRIWYNNSLNKKLEKKEGIVMAGKLLVIEGLDGSGKTTQTQLLKAALEKDGLPLRQIKLPDYDDPSSTLVKMYLAGDFGNTPDAVNPYSASVFYAADRYASYQRHWKEDYLSGKLILADRYTTSNAVHQMVKLPREEWDEYLQWLQNLEFSRMQIPRPDAVVYLDMPVEVSQKLLTSRYHGDEQKKDVHEANTGYLKACRETALYAAEAMGWHVIPCAQDGEPLPIAKIHESIRACLSKELF